MPLDNIKIDRSFISHVEEDTARSIVAGVLGIAERLGLKATAEGIETDAQQDRLTALDCPLGQGYLFSRPLSEDDFVAFVMQDITELV